MQNAFLPSDWNRWADSPTRYDEKQLPIFQQHRPRRISGATILQEGSATGSGRESFVDNPIDCFVTDNRAAELIRNETRLVRFVDPSILNRLLINANCSVGRQNPACRISSPHSRFRHQRNQQNNQNPMLFHNNRVEELLNLVYYS